MATDTSIPLYHTDPLVSTVAGFIAQQRLKDLRGMAGSNSTGGKQLTPDELLDFSSEGLTNRERVRREYNARERARIPEGTEANLLKPGTLLQVPKWAFDFGYYIDYAGTAVVKTADLDQQLADYFGKYALSAPIRLYQPGARTHVNRAIPRWRVWAYCKALGSDNDPLGGRLVDLSPLVMTIGTRSNQNGTNLQLTFAPVTARPGEPLLDALRRVTPLDGRLVSGSAPTATRSFLHDNEHHHRPLLPLVLQPNDLLFVALDVAPTSYQLQPDQQRLATTLTGDPQRWDVLALVDDTSASHDAEGTSLSVSVRASDYMKLLIEDGDFYKINGFAAVDDTTSNEYQKNLLGQAGNADNNPILRRLDGATAGLYFYLNRPLEAVLGGILGQLSHVRIAPDVLFAPWGEERAQYLRGDKIDTLRLEVGDGIWSIIKLQIDQTVRDRRVTNTSLSAYQGSLLGIIQQVCQAPFAEFYGETLANQYYMIARRSPFSERDIRQLLAITDALPDYNIALAHVLNVSLNFDYDASYAWFQVTPGEALLGQVTGLSPTYFLPPVFFPEFATLWGAARQLDIPSNLLSLLPGGPAAPRTGSMLEQATLDLRWLIETHAFLPFTRRGTITIRHDARIKRGTWIRFLPTEEVFYVDGVEHNAHDGLDGVSLSTTLHVVRGMVDRDDEGKPTLARYFRLVDFGGEDGNNYTQRGSDVGQTTTSTSRLHLHYPADGAIPYLPDPALATAPHRPSGYGLAAQPTDDDPLAALTTDNALSLADVIGRLSDPGATLKFSPADGDDLPLNVRRVAWLRDYLAQQVAGGSGPRAALDAARVRERITASPTAAGASGAGQTFALEWRTPRPPVTTTGQRPRLTWKVDRKNLLYFLRRRQFS
jgi:hypothetical protein